MNLNFLIEFINNNGFPTFIVLCVLYILYYIWRFVSLVLKPKLISILEILNELASISRMCRSDIDKLNQKITIIQVIKDKEIKRASENHRE